MKLSKSIPHLITLASATAWELTLLYKLPPEYYVGASCLQTHPYPICGFHFRPSLTFVLLVMAPFAVSIFLGLWRKWEGLLTFGAFSFAIVSVTLLLLYLFEKSWIPVAGAVITSAVLYGAPCRRMGHFTKGEKIVWTATSIIVSFILCIMVWGGISVAV